MEILNVDADSASYPIYITGGFGALERAISDAGLSGRKAVVVTDENVAALHLKAFKDAIANVFSEVHEIIFQPGEASKHLGTISRLYDGFVEFNLDRRSVVLALGGGVTGDMAGFAAATYMRGIPYVQIPTTLLSQVDSSVGGKTGVDYAGLKNIVGAFYQPKLVYVNVELLKTLPETEIISGLGEVVKHGIIADKDYFDFLCGSIPKIGALDTDALIKTVHGSCRVKSEIVSRDEREGGLREILNFGHTFGHAVESLSDFSLPHGHCVALGMVCALAYSLSCENLPAAEMERCLALFDACGFGNRLPNALAARITPGDIFSRMGSDKKNKDGQITLVCVDAIGNAYSIKAPDTTGIINAIEKIF